ncbi:YbaL family putative K(+) efflux transporter [Neoroseomonas lacus]|uniref:Potassium efflux system protein n=1 Tax=Neoroseomonas lacus TaxID=287609 RepID=A0A917KB57_9PROT|nr:YbaL family putative K(+) efflux transporter [Neoroseomonas lacus]GGJ03853.1 potassium efflux system protein [Neoroseomonas lacus]
MPDHGTPLITTIVVGLALAFAFGLAAQRLRISPLVGYLLAGVAVGPFTPGFIADASLAGELAEIGIILLMFAVGLHFSWRDLMSVGAIAIPGAVVQIGVATLLGFGLAWLLGWSLPAGLVFGLALSVASTVVLVRALQERRIMDSERGRIAVGWLVVEDLAMVIALVLLPALAGSSLAGQFGAGDLALTLALTFGKVALFGASMLVIGRRAIPWLLHYVAHTGSRELFRLAVYVIALGVAFGAAKLFGVSFALGAFFAGMVLSESKLSQRAAEEAMPLRDAFAVLFFVSVGMLFDPGVLLRDPLGVIGTVLIIVVGKSVAAYGIVRAFGHGHGTALTIAASLAQIGEFSFILAGIGVSLAVLPPEGRDLVLAGAILSILVNPLLFLLVERRLPAAVKSPVPPPPTPAPAETGHEIVVGYGRVGGLVGKRLAAAGRTVVVIEAGEQAAEAARADGARVISGNAADPTVLAEADIAAARHIFVAIPETFEAGQVVEQARAAKAGLEILARADSDEAVEHLTRLGATLTVMGEREIAHRMLERALGRPGARPASAAPAGGH